MPYALPDGRTLPMDTPWEYNDISYPANWLRLSTEDDRAQLGIVWEPDPAPYDQRFYWGPGLPKDHAQLVEQWVAQTRTTAGSLLAPSDWMVIREADNGIAVPADWRTWRETVRLAAGSKVFEIEQTADTPALAAYITSAAYSAWPSDPNAAAVPDPADGVQPVVDGEAGLN